MPARGKFDATGRGAISGSTASLGG